MTGKGTKMVIRWDRNAGKASCDRDTQPNLRCVLGVSVFHTSSNSDLDYSPIFNVRTDVNACDCTRVCTDTVRESALKVDSGRKSLAAPGNRTCDSGVPVRRYTKWATCPPNMRTSKEINIVNFKLLVTGDSGKMTPQGVKEGSRWTPGG